MDAVILAAGKGSRLGGIVPPYFKPLLVMGGKSLIRRCVDEAMRVKAERIIVVVAPENAQHVASVLQGPGLGIVQLIVQTHALGPGHALRTGLQLVRSEGVLVMMGDNYVTDDDLNIVTEAWPSVGCRAMREGIERFTYYDVDSKTWVEKQEPADDKVRDAWCGPFFVGSEDIRQALKKLHRHTERGELGIGESFNYLRHAPARVQVNSIDVGVPEELT